MFNKKIKIIWTIIFAGIFLCLVSIISHLGQISSNLVQQQSNMASKISENIIVLDPNTIAVTNTNLNSGNRGDILVFEFDRTSKSFHYMGQMNYLDYINNPLYKSGDFPAESEGNAIGD